VGIIGRNGAGTLAPACALAAAARAQAGADESTLLKILSRITEPTSGRAGSLLEVRCSVSHTVVVGVQWCRSTVDYID